MCSSDLSICYDYTMASIVDESRTEMILVGDSLGNVVMGVGSTVPVSLDIIIHHARCVVRGAPNTFVVGDMPFGTYNVNCDQAITTANRIMQEGGSDCVKLEGGANMADKSFSNWSSCYWCNWFYIGFIRSTYWSQ